MNVSPIWVTARNRPGWLTQLLDPARAAVAFVDQLLDARPAHRDERDLGRHEDRPRRRSGGR